MARAIWSGSISFGLVNVPVRLFTAVRDHTVHMAMLTRDGHCRVRQKLYCPETGQEVEYKDTVRGYEIAPDQYVIFTPEEIASIAPAAARTIDIKAFVKIEQIDPINYDRPYYLLPDERGARAYRLLVEAMSNSGRVGIAQFVMRQKEYLAALRPVDNMIYLETMNYADEVVPRDEVGEPPSGAVEDKQLQIAQRLIDALAEDFEPAKYRDEYRDRLMEMIQRKSEGEEIVVQAPPPESGRVINLMDALQKSLEQIKSPQASAPKPKRRKSA